MAKTIAQLRTEAQTIKNETTIGANTATRVGGFGEDIVDYLEDNPSSGGTFATGEDVGDVSLFDELSDLGGKTTAQKEAMLPDGNAVEELVGKTKFGYSLQVVPYTAITNGKVYYKSGTIIKQLSASNGSSAVIELTAQMVSFSLLFTSVEGTDPNIWTVFTNVTNNPLGNRYYCDGVTAITINEVPATSKYLYVSSRKQDIVINITYQIGNQLVNDVKIVDASVGGANNVLSAESGKNIKDTLDALNAQNTFEYSILERGFFQNGVIESDGDRVVSASTSNFVCSDKISIPDGAKKINIPYCKSYNQYPHSVVLDSNDNVLAAYSAKGDSELLQTGWIDLPTGATSILVTIPVTTYADNSAKLEVRETNEQYLVNHLFKTVDYSPIVENTIFQTGYLKPNGDFVGDANYIFSDYIAIPDGVVNMRFSFSRVSVVVATLLYNADKTIANAYYPNVASAMTMKLYEYINLPSTVKYIRFSFPNSVAVGDIVLEFDMGDYVIASPVKVDQLEKIAEKVTDKCSYIEAEKRKLLYDAIIDNSAVTATGWTLSAGKYTNSGTGFTNKLLIDRFYWNSHRIIVADFVAPVNSKVYVGFDGNNVYQTSLVSVDMSDNTFNLHEAPSSAISSIYESVSFVSNSTSFRIEVRTRERGSCDLQLIDMDKGCVVAHIEKPMQFAIPSWGLFFDSPYIIADTAGVQVTRFQVLTCYSDEPLLQIIGDSISQGYYAEKGKDFASLLASSLGENNVIKSGRSGGTAYQVQNILTSETSILRPRYVMVTMGTNDNVEKSTFLSIISGIVAIGSVPIINHIPCGRGAYSGFSNKNSIIDTAISESGEAVLTVRMDNATAIANDVQNGIDVELFNDTGHPNTFGHSRMYDQVLVDAMDLIGY